MIPQAKDQQHPTRVSSWPLGILFSYNNTLHIYSVKWGEAKLSKSRDTKILDCKPARRSNG
ncbi:hypothetical protein BDFG_00129 [Blastomyces dermatitidis ATCC 26199]|nr:hypothetical protein BDFG_00129 [Blastomyces dermatitidis ATCC 26199]